ncbi:hypothetical protein ABVT39_003814 [Epinephelus coioides]
MELLFVKFKEKIEDLSCGDDLVTLLSETGKVLCVDTTCTYIPRPVEALCNIVVSQVACGSQHSDALTKNGQVYTWGQDSRGQLGLGRRKLGASSPQHLRSLSAIPLVQIAAGGEQSFALSVSGGVFGWGRNNCGQLGLGDTTDRNTPTPVHCLNMKKSIHISCGKDHTAVLTKHLPNLQPVNGVPWLLPQSTLDLCLGGDHAASPPAWSYSQGQYNSVPVPGLPDGQSLHFVGVLNEGVLYKVPEGHFALPVPAVPPLNTSSSKKRKREKEPFVKKPLNAFMLFLKEHRAKAGAELQGRGSAAINTVLGQIWNSLTKEEQAKYFRQAETERVLHAQRHPEWSPSDNFVSPTCSHTTHTSIHTE